MKNKNLLGGILATISALMGIIGHFVLFLKWYQIGMHTPSAEPGCEILLKYIHPLMADFGILAGVLFAVSAYGFFTKRNWAFLFLKVVREAPWSKTLLSLLTGVAYIFCWMNGVASTSRIITIGSPIFMLVQHLHWVAMVGWAIVTVGIVIKPKEWMRVVGLVASSAELVVGIPLTVATAQQLGRFSLFALGPIACLALLVILVWPGLWQRWTGSE